MPPFRFLCLSLTMALVASGCSLFKHKPVAERALVGRVVEAVTGRPIADVTVIGTIWTGGLLDGRPRQVTSTTDSTGRYRLRYISARTVGVEAFAPGYLPLDAEATLTAADGDAPGPDISLTPEPRTDPLPSNLNRAADTSLVGWRDDSLATGFSLLAGRTVGDTTRADFIALPDTSLGALHRLRALGSGGFVPFAGHTAQSVGHYLMWHTPEAPASGYVPEIDLDALPDRSGFFVRTRDGKHYGKIFVTRRSSLDRGRDLAIRFIWMVQPETGVRRLETTYTQPVRGFWFR